MRWYKELNVGESYFIVGFADPKLTVPFVSTYVYIGIGALADGTKDRQCFQDCSSYFSDEGEQFNKPEEQEPDYVVLDEESLDMVTDKAGLIAWLKSLDSTSAASTKEKS